MMHIASPAHSCMTYAENNARRASLNFSRRRPSATSNTAAAAHLLHAQRTAHDTKQGHIASVSFFSPC